MGAAIFVRYSKHSDLSFVSVQQMFASNSRSVKQTEQTFNKTFAVFAVLNGPQAYPKLQIAVFLCFVFQVSKLELFFCLCYTLCPSFRLLTICDLVSSFQVLLSSW